MLLPDIRTLVPHDGKMLLIDRIINADAETVRAEVIIRKDSLFFDASINGVGAWVGIEYMAQTIAAWAGYNARLRNEAVKLGFLLGARNYKSMCSAFALESVLQITAHCLLQADNGMGSFECTISNKGALIANGTLNVFQPEDVEKFLT